MTPQDLDLERGILGGALVDPKVQGQLVELVDPDAYFRQSHRLVHRSIARLYRANATVDLLTVVADLRAHGDLEACGGPNYVAGLCEGAVLLGDLKHHARALSRIYRSRRRSELTAQLSGACEDPELSASLAGQIQRLCEPEPAGSAHVSSGLTEIFTRSLGSVLPLGIEGLSKLKVRPGNLCGIAARPGGGKSAMLGTIALAAATEGRPVLLLSLEMPAAEIRARLLAGISRIDLSEVQEPTDARLAPAVERLSTLPIWIDDEEHVRLSLEQILSLSRAFARDHENAVILVDYLQLITTAQRFERRYEQIGHACRELKYLARAASVPVVVAVQLSRAAEDRKRPQLSDLRESGEIEQTCDQVVLMHYEESEGHMMRVAKQRNGPTFTAQVRYTGALCLFEDRDAFL